MKSFRSGSLHFNQFFISSSTHPSLKARTAMTTTRMYIGEFIENVTDAVTHTQARIFDSRVKNGRLIING